MQATEVCRDRRSLLQDEPIFQDFPFVLSPLIRGRGFFLRFRSATRQAAVFFGLLSPQCMNKSMGHLCAIGAEHQR